MKVRIRRAGLKDVDAIVSLSRQLADYHRDIDSYYKPGSETARGFRRHLLKNIRRRNARIVLAETDDKAVGYFIGSIEKPKPYASPKRIGRISGAFIQEGYRNSGIGRKMFEELMEWFREKGIKHIELYVDSRNNSGLKTWKRFGFREYMKKMRLDL